MIEILSDERSGNSRGREELTCPGTGFLKHNSSVFVLVVYERSMA
ncbi:hypothetical protein [Chitinophaga tropicalis]|nr:hypothetical protein [Chitinophaga tropicalis]